MKKSIIASLVALGVVSGLAQAADHDVTFQGSVTTVTCDLDVSGAGVNGNLPNMVDLGQAKIGDVNSGKVVDFVFKPSQTAGNQAACDAMDASKAATLTWFGSTFDGNGLGKTGGTAEGAHVKLMATNATSANNSQPVTASGTAHEFSAGNLKTGGDGLKYSAQLIPGASAGSFEAVARYALSYK